MSNKMSCSFAGKDLNNGLALSGLISAKNFCNICNSFRLQVTRFLSIFGLSFYL